MAKSQSQQTIEEIRTLLADRRFDEAKTRLHAALEEEKDEPQKIALFDLLSNACRQTNDLESALSAAKTALDLGEKYLNEDSLTLAALLHNLSMTLDQAQNYSEAIPYAEKELSILRRSVPATDRRVANCLLSLAKHHYELGRFGLAKEMVQDLLTRYKEHDGEESLGVSACLNNLGRILEHEGAEEEALPLFQQSVHIRQKLLGSHEDTAFSLLNLGTCLAALAEWKKAAEALIASRDMYEELGMHDSPYLQAARDNILLCWNNVCTPC
ncbi:MAG: tetratricopeptide repeat protein [Desulfovibrio sp.]|nr:tetratricopeptide repeat protein [Desulfovibrio sp.]